MFCLSMGISIINLKCGVGHTTQTRVLFKVWNVSFKRILLYLEVYIVYIHTCISSTSLPFHIHLLKVQLLRRQFLFLMVHIIQYLIELYFWSFILMVLMETHRLLNLIISLAILQVFKLTLPCDWILRFHLNWCFRQLHYQCRLLKCTKEWASLLISEPNCDWHLYFQLHPIIECKWPNIYLWIVFH